MARKKTTRKKETPLSSIGKYLAELLKEPPKRKTTTKNKAKRK